jgi:very-short-patch-repair endonuclease
MVQLWRADSSSEPVDAAIARLAASQYGVFAREQAFQLGATRSMVEHRLGTGRWECPSRNVYRLAGAAPSWRQTLMVACLAWGAGAFVSHGAGAALWVLASFEPRKVQLTVPPDRRRNGPGMIYRRSLRPDEVTTVAGIPVTTPARTLLDVAATAPRDAVEEALDDALRRRLVTIPRLRWRLASWGKRRSPGVTTLRELIGARDPTASPPQSVFETRLLRLMLRKGLPAPICQYQIEVDGRKIVLDFAFPDAKLAVEADGFRWHSSRLRWEHDRERLTRLSLLGWRIIHVTRSDLTTRPDAVIESISRALRGPTSAE